MDGGSGRLGCADPLVRCAKPAANTPRQPVSDSDRGVEALAADTELDHDQDHHDDEHDDASGGAE